MPRKYREYTDEQFTNCVKEVKSLAGLLRALNLRPAGGNYAHAKYTLQRLNLSTEHWTGQSWSKGKQLKNWSSYTKAVRLKPHLIKLRGHKCECCNLSEWLNNLIPLEIHHKDGNRTNNVLDNLELLCNNCHALTDFWRNKKRVVDNLKITDTL